MTSFRPVTTCLLISSLCIVSAQTNELKIHSVDKSGNLIFKSIPNVAHYQVEKTGALDDDWGNISPVCQQIGMGSITCKVDTAESAQFYRISTQPTAIPTGQVLIPGGENSGTNALGTGLGESHDWTYPETYSLNAESFNMDQCETSLGEVVQVLNWAHDHGHLWVGENNVTNAHGSPRLLLALSLYNISIRWDGNSFSLPDTTFSNAVCEITWHGAVAFCNYKSEMRGKAPCYNLSDWSCNIRVPGFRLPTSEEWEYAARGGTKSSTFPWGNTITHEQANYNSQSSVSYDVSLTRGSHPDYRSHLPETGLFEPNAYGLYDTVGNIWEWTNSSSNDIAIARGGGTTSWVGMTRTGHRVYFTMDSTLGFRTISR